MRHSSRETLSSYDNGSGLSKFEHLHSNSGLTIPSASSYPPQGSTRSTNIPNGIYQIVNLDTGAYAGLLDGDERSEVVSLTVGLDDNETRGSNVSLLIFSMPSTELAIKVVD